METALTTLLHAISTGGILLLLAIVFQQHKIWVRIKDRVNQLWLDRCNARDDEYVPLDNGH